MRFLAADGSYRNPTLNERFVDGSEDAGIIVPSYAPVVTRVSDPVKIVRARGGSGAGRISVASVPGLGTGPILLDDSPAPRTPKPMQPAAPAQPAAVPGVARSVGSAAGSSQLLAVPSGPAFSIGKALGIVLLLALLLFLVVRRLEL